MTQTLQIMLEQSPYKADLLPKPDSGIIYLGMAYFQLSSL